MAERQSEKIRERVKRHLKAAADNAGIDIGEQDTVKYGPGGCYNEITLEGLREAIDALIAAVLALAEATKNEC